MMKGVGSGEVKGSFWFFALRDITLVCILPNKYIFTLMFVWFCF